MSFGWHESAPSLTLSRETFKEHNLICLAKIREPGQIEWLRNDDCVWSGPPWLTAKRRLDGAYGTLTHLFKDTLSIRDFNWRDCLLELKSMRSTQENTSTKASAIYHWLMLDFLHHENGWEELRCVYNTSWTLQPANALVVWHSRGCSLSMCRR